MEEWLSAWRRSKKRDIEVFLQVANKKGIILSMKKYWSGAHTLHRLMYHIVWIPKYRKRVLNGRLAERLKELLYECAQINDWEIQELNIQEDHVHLIVQIKPSISLSDAVQYLKGGTSKKIREEFPELKEFLWGTNLWSDGYFAETVGSVNEEKLRAYVRNQ